jgi:hypothetical protein
MLGELQLVLGGEVDRADQLAFDQDRQAAGRLEPRPLRHAGAGVVSPVGEVVEDDQVARLPAAADQPLPLAEAELAGCPPHLLGHRAGVAREPHHALDRVEFPDGAVGPAERLENPLQRREGHLALGRGPADGHQHLAGGSGVDRHLGVAGLVLELLGDNVPGEHGAKVIARRVHDRADE